MHRPSLRILTGITIVLLARIASAAPILSIDDLPSSYQPGEQVSFHVSLTGAENLGAYNIDIVLESAEGFAGSDFFFDVIATEPASSDYLFPSNAFFFDATNEDSPSKHRITLSDFDVTGVDSVAGVNDQIATVVFSTSANFAGLLAISLDAQSLILDTPDISPTSISGFPALQNALASTPPLEITPVPEPTSLFLLLTVLLGCCSTRKHF